MPEQEASLKLVFQAFLLLSPEERNRLAKLKVLSQDTVSTWMDLNGKSRRVLADVKDGQAIPRAFRPHVGAKFVRKARQMLRQK